MIIDKNCKGLLILEAFFYDFANAILDIRKGQLISEAFFHGIPYFKKSVNFLQISALVFKMDQIKKNKILVIRLYLI
jgi:hypothetical protein